MIEGSRVIDFHGHVGRWDIYGMIDNPDLMLQAMDAVGIDHACLFHIFHPEGRRKFAVGWLLSVTANLNMAGDREETGQLPAPPPRTLKTSPGRGFSGPGGPD